MQELNLLLSQCLCDRHAYRLMAPFGNKTLEEVYGLPINLAADNHFFTTAK